MPVRERSALPFEDARIDDTRMVRTRTITALLFGIVLTALALQWDARPAYPWAYWCVPCAVIALGLPTKRFGGSMFTAAGIGALLAFVAVARTTHIATPDTIDWYADGSIVEIEGVVSERPEYGMKRTVYVVAVERAIVRNELKTLSGRIRVQDKGGWPRVPYGGKLRARGELSLPSADKDFRYDLFLSTQNIAAILDTWSVEPQPGGTEHPIVGALQAARDRVETQIQRLYGEPESSLLMGLLTGARREMPDALKANLATTGLTHLVAISGSNITILLAVIEASFFWLPQRFRLLPGFGLIVAFVLFVGASASVLRAAVMGVLGMLAAHTGRIPHRRLTVLWTLAILTLWNPRQLWYDPGFHLSFLALVGIAELGPLLEPWLRWVPERFGLREALTVSCSAQLATAPWSAFLFGQVSFVAPLSNLFGPPLVPAAMGLGALSVALGMLCEPLGLLAGLAAWLPLKGILLTADTFAALPLAAFQWRMNGVLVVLSYGAMAFWIAWNERRAIPDTRNPKLDT